MKEQWTIGPWLRINQLIYSLMDAGTWRKGIRDQKNRFTCQVLFDRSVPPEEREATLQLIYSVIDEDAALTCCVKTLENLLELGSIPFKNEISAAVTMGREALEKARGL